MPAEGDLERAGRILRQARIDADNAIRNARTACIEAADAGTPETTLALKLGVTRQTVRVWLGKS
jgi:hypothetical protein